MQKISRRSKAIRKKEQAINDSLKRKRIYLEKDNFDLMNFLRNSLEAADHQIKAKEQQREQMEEKAKTDLKTPSQYASTIGTKSGTDMRTQSV